MMPGFYKLLVLLGVLLPARHVQLETHGCQLLPSKLGPDWYKQPQIVPEGFEHLASYLHMPCPIGTLFDEGICTCTNMAAYLFSGIEKLSEATDMTMLDPQDFIKERDPDDFSTSSEKPGSYLLNTRTGEVTHCPFRASSRGSMWYLVREPTDIWRPMKCAPGTVFEKRSCTCIHESLASREPVKPEDLDIMVLEDEYGEASKENTISSTLQIKTSDVDFSSSAPDSFWSQPSLDSTYSHDSTPVQNAIVVTLNNGDGSHDMKPIVTSKERLPQKGPVKPDITRTASMHLDSIQSGEGVIDTAFAAENKRQSLVFEPLGFTDSPVVPKNKQESISDTQKWVLPHDSSIRDNAFIERTRVENQVPNNPNDADMAGPVDEVYFPLIECAKRPVPDLGPEYFSLYFWGVGWIPYACHGDRVYSDLLCACVPIPG